jgi:hypothetical protein
MVKIDEWRSLWRQTTVYCPNPNQLRTLIKELAFNQILIVRQTEAVLPANTPGIVNQGPFDTVLIDLQRSVEELLADMHPRATRYRIRKAEKMIDRIVVRRNDERAMLDLFQMLRRFIEANGHMRPPQMSHLRAYSPVSDVFVAYFDGRPVCGHLVIRDEEQKRVGGIYAASVRLQDPSAPCALLNRFLHWHEMQTYKAEGFKWYDLGGVGPDAPSVGQFKLYFGGAPRAERFYLIARRFGRCALLSNALLRRYYNWWRIRSAPSRSAQFESLQMASGFNSPTVDGSPDSDRPASNP